MINRLLPVAAKMLAYVVPPLLQLPSFSNYHLCPINLPVPNYPRIQLKLSGYIGCSGYSKTPFSFCTIDAVETSFVADCIACRTVQYLTAVENL